MKIHQAIIGLILLTSSAAWKYEPDHPPPDNLQARLRDPKIIAAIERKLSALRCVGDLGHWRKIYYIESINGKSIRNIIKGHYLAIEQLNMHFEHEDKFDLVLFNYEVKQDKLNIEFCDRGSLESGRRERRAALRRLGDVL